MAQISFSIVVVCLNPGEKLLKTVQSVLNQKYGNYEIVVKDGGSTARLPGTTSGGQQNPGLYKTGQWDL